MSAKVLLAVLVTAAFLSAGCSGPGGAAVQSNSEFISLFNGTDLSGWKASGGARWIVQDGTIIGTQGENNAPGDLFTENTYTDFEVNVTYRVEWPCNSGVWFRYQSPEKAYQADILEYKNPECYSGTLYCPGKMFLFMNTDKTIIDRDGWNTIKARVKGDHIQVYMNGWLVGDVHDDTSDSGTIGFQIHAGDHFGPMKIVIREVLLKHI